LSFILNVIEWGDGIYGAEAAAEHYFHKPASALSANEAAFLSAMIPNPRTVFKSASQSSPRRAPAENHSARQCPMFVCRNPSDRGDRSANKKSRFPKKRLLFSEV